MFQVRAVVVGFLGNTDAYPCHMHHEVGDEVIFDGERYHGRLCPDVWPLIVPKVAAIHQAGPRYVEWVSYYPFWYCSPSARDPSMKKVDGVGFRNVLETIEPPKYDMANLVNPEAFRWPPSEKEGLGREATVICPDSRTSMVMRIEACDLSEKGFDAAYFRRQMAILAKLRAGSGVEKDKVLATFSQSEIEDIYPPLSTMMVRMLTEELELMGYVKTAEGMTAITSKGETKLADFEARLPNEDREAFGAYTR